MLYDVHAHLESRAFDKDRDILIKKCSGKVIVINNGLNPKSNRKTLGISDYKTVFPALGLYPWDGVKIPWIDIDREIEFIKKQGIVAIGEIGLDYYWGRKPQDIKKQKQIFEKMLDLAEQMSLPVIVHSRNAEKDVLSILKKHDVEAIMHCFGGKINLVKKGVEQGCWFSIPPNIIRAYSFQKLADEVPISQILTETDSPYLSPVPKQRNEPLNVGHSVKKIAEIKGLNPVKTEEIIEKNVMSLFRNIFK